MQCLHFLVTESPVLGPCSLQVEGADGAQLSTTCLPGNQSSPVTFTRISPYRIQGTWQSRYSGPADPPPRPAYIHGYEVGLAISELVAHLTRAASMSSKLALA